MELRINTQIAQAAASLAVGLSLGLYYDFLRIFRLRLRADAVTLALDVLFWAGAALALFSLGLGPGEGELRLFMLIGAALGASAYFSALSGLVMAVLNLIADLIARFVNLIAGLIARFFALLLRPLHIILVFLKNISENLKKLFQNGLKWFTIKFNGKVWFMRSRKPRGNASEGSRNEAQKGRIYYENHYSGGSSLRAYQSHVAADSDDGYAEAQKRDGSGGRRAYSVKRGISIRNRPQ